MRLLPILMLVGLGACTTPAMQRLQAACDAGDTRACETIVIQQQAAMRSAFSNNDPGPYIPPLEGLPERQGVYCLRTIGGNLSCY